MRDIGQNQLTMVSFSPLGNRAMFILFIWFVSVYVFSEVDLYTLGISLKGEGGATNVDEKWEGLRVSKWWVDAEVEGECVRFLVTDKGSLSSLLLSSNKIRYCCCTRTYFFLKILVNGVFGKSSSSISEQ